MTVWNGNIVDSHIGRYQLYYSYRYNAYKYNAYRYNTYRYNYIRDVDSEISEIQHNKNISYRIDIQRQAFDNVQEAKNWFNEYVNFINPL